MSGLLPTSELRKPTKFAHIVLRSKHFEETIAWYEAVLGTTVVHRNPMLCFVTYDDEHHRLAFVNVGNAEDPAPGGVGSERIKGSESYSSISPSWLTMLGDSAARRYNEVINGRDRTNHSQGGLV